MIKKILRFLIYCWIFLIGAWSPVIYMYMGSIGSQEVDSNFAMSTMSLVPYSALIVGPAFVGLYYFFHGKYEKTANSILILFTGFYIGSFVVAQFLNEEYKVSNATIAGLITSLLCLTAYLTFKQRMEFIKGGANSEKNRGQRGKGIKDQA